MKTNKKTRSEWLALVENWKQSGQSQRAYCESHGVNAATFSYWRGQYLRDGSKTPAGFVALKPMPEPEGIKLRLGGLEVELIGGAAYVAEVLLKLAERC
ncbi:MAG: transposase [Bacteroidia bacterium]|nr:transposase [Bacteroidia bacterium]